MSGDSSDFYSRLPASTLEEALSGDLFQDLPSDWWVFVADVRNSTEAIESGQYRHVNVAGSLPISVLSNVIGHLDFPFVFGGDGCIALIPAAHLTNAREEIARIRSFVKEQLGLDLRTRFHPMDELSKREFVVKVARIRISDRYTQAAIIGDGLVEAERLLKEPAGASVEEAERSGAPVSPDFAGFNCRWRDVPAGRGYIVSLIVDCGSRVSIYGEVLESLKEICGSDSHPLASGNLLKAAGGEALNLDARIQSARTPGRPFWKEYLVRKVQMLIVNTAIRFQFPGLKAGATYLRDIARLSSQSSDILKLDGTLKLVCRVDEKQKGRLLEYLNRMEEDGNLQYGSAASTAATVTCTVHQNGKEEVHFVDGSAGGYTRAAVQLKQKRKRP